MKDDVNRKDMLALQKIQEEKLSKLVSSAVEEIERVAKLHGIDIESKAAQLFPNLPKELQYDAASILVKTHGVEALGIFQDTENIPYFQEQECIGEECDNMVGITDAFWLHMGYYKYIRIKCPACKIMYAPDGFWNEKRVSEKSKIVESLGFLEEVESVSDIEIIDEEEPLEGEGVKMND